MNINRNTYESYFLLYVDNELSAEERAAVDAFLMENPDLSAEMEMLKETVLVPDSTQIFSGKETLVRGIVNPVNETNYEEYFVQFLDNELSTQEAEQVNEFIRQHPQYAEELELIRSCRIVADTSVVFENKEVLYKYENEGRVIWINWKKMAAAAAVLILAGWFYLESSEPKGGQLATTQPKGVESKPAKSPAASVETAPIAEEKIGEQTTAKQNIENGQEVVVPSARIDHDIKKEKKSAAESNKSIMQDVKPETTEMANMKLPVDPEAAKVQTAISTLDPLISVKDVAVDEKALSQRSELSLEMAEELAIDESTDSNVIYVANTTVNKKNKLRGFFRTASRIVERATSMEPSQHDRAGIRIANFEIDLK